MAFENLIVTWAWSFPDAEPEGGKRAAWVTATATDRDRRASVSTEFWLDALKPDQNLVALLPSSGLEARALVALAETCPN